MPRSFLITNVCNKGKNLRSPCITPFRFVVQTIGRNQFKFELTQNIPSSRPGIVRSVALRGFGLTTETPGVNSREYFFFCTQRQNRKCDHCRLLSYEEPLFIPQVVKFNTNLKKGGTEGQLTCK